MSHTTSQPPVWDPQQNCWTLNGVPVNPPVTQRVASPALLGAMTPEEFEAEVTRIENLTSDEVDGGWSIAVGGMTIIMLLLFLVLLLS